MVFLALFVALVLGANHSLCQECVDLESTCRIRHELQFDFAFAFQWNCTRVFNCICFKGMDIAFYEMPPYIILDSKDQKQKGLLAGERFMT